MRKFSGATIITLLVFLVSTVYAQAGTIAVKVTQIDVKGGGEVKIGVYDSEGFPLIGKDLEGVDLKVKESSATHVFNNIPVGIYAIAVIQDENMDGKLTKNFLGAPKEPYGFSKNKYRMFGPPKFKDVSFAVENEGNISLTVNLE
jgi:uncharacterized protein (DUF2141 family)